MTRSRGTDQERQQRVQAARAVVLARLKEGTTLEQACTEAGVVPATIRYHAERDERFRQELLDAGWRHRRSGPPLGARQKSPISEDALLKRLADGDAFTVIAADLGISGTALRERINRDPALKAKVDRLRPPRPRERPEPRWLQPLVALLEQGAPFNAACTRVGIASMTGWHRRQTDSKVDAAVREAIERGRQPESQWRRGSRDSQARYAHNHETREWRRDKALERFTPDTEQVLLEMLRRGASLPDALSQLDLTQQAVFGRARWDAAWARRLNGALMAGRNPDISHGTVYSYKRRGCRCPDCRRANDRSRGAS